MARSSYGELKDVDGLARAIDNVTHKRFPVNANPAAIVRFRADGSHVCGELRNTEIQKHIMFVAKAATHNAVGIAQMWKIKNDILRT